MDEPYTPSKVRRNKKSCKLVIKQKLKATMRKSHFEKIEEEEDPVDIVDIIKSRFASAIKEKLRLNLDLLTQSNKKTNANSLVGDAIEQLNKKDTDPCNASFENTHSNSDSNVDTNEISVDETFEESFTNESIKCNKCDMILKITEFSIDENNSESLKCRFCEDIFLNKECMKMHHSQAHAKYICSFCDLTYSQISSYQSHMQNHIAFHQCDDDNDEDDENKAMKRNYLYLYKCDECEVIFSTKYHLKKHKEIDHVVTFKCIDCKLEFTTSASLRIHLRSHQFQIYICEYCSKQFQHLPSYKRHLYNKETYTCELCHEQFKYKCSYEMHMEKRVLKCEYCGKTYTRKEAFWKHLLTHGGDLLCDICAEGLLSEDILKLHQMVVHGIKNLKIQYNFELCKRRVKC